MSNLASKKEDKKEAKLSKKVEGLVNDISKLSVLELSELVNGLQDKLGVSAAAPVAAAAAPAAGGDAGGTDQPGTSAAKQTVILTAIGENKISAIKAIREINPTLGLKEAKDMTENLPAEIIKDIKAEEAKEASEKLTGAGAKVELK